MANPSTRPPVDRYLLLEVALVLLLVGASLPLFLVPVASEGSRPEWWAVPLLAALFFGAVGLHAWRRRRGGRLGLLRAEVRGKRGAEGGEA